MARFSAVFSGIKKALASGGKGFFGGARRTGCSRKSGRFLTALANSFGLCGGR
jgi:hypothetical protein